MRTRSYYATTQARPVLVRWLRRLWPGRDYTGWTVRATTDRDVPTGTTGRVLASKRRRDERVHVIGFPDLNLHVPLPWPGIELIRPTGR